MGDARLDYQVEHSERDVQRVRAGFGPEEVSLPRKTSDEATDVAAKIVKSRLSA